MIEIKVNIRPGIGGNVISELETSGIKGMAISAASRR
jgi:hypothetical protein